MTALWPDGPCYTHTHTHIHGHTHTCTLTHKHILCTHIQYKYMHICPLKLQHMRDEDVRVNISPLGGGGVV